jgi:prepilin-type N-terminal cleavage/methylation domain-containing protein
MVLGMLPPGGRQRGLTLIELLIAVAMAGLVAGMAMALFKDMGGAARLIGGRARGDFASQVALTSLSRNLMYGAGVVRLGPNALDLLNTRGKRVEYRWGDSSLTVNGRPLDFRLASMTVEASGPMIPIDADGQPDWDLAPGLDSLDENRDGTVDFEELDRNGDGELDMYECRFISLIRLTMTTKMGEVSSSRAMAVHPRNHARDSLGTGTDSSGQTDPFP